MSLLAHRARGEHGFTLVEVLAASVMLLVGILGVVSLFDYANLETARNRDREAANNLARQITETAKKLPYSAVTGTGIGSSLRAQSGLEDDDTGTSDWEINSRGVTFRVTATACSEDDSKDGYGAHASGTTWCSTSTGTADSSPEDYKRLTVQVEPTSGSLAGKTTRMSSFIANDRLTDSSGGGTVGAGYAILMDGLCGGCDLDAWTDYGQAAPCVTFTTTVGAGKCNPTYNGAAGTNFSAGNQITAIPVRAIFPMDAASVRFYLLDWPAHMALANPPAYVDETYLGDGTLDTDNARQWTYTWSLQNTYPNQTPDGYYAIKAWAYDSGGNRTGRPLVMSFWLNRFIPDMRAWGTPIAGRNQFTCSGGPSSSGCTNAKPEVEWRVAASGTARRDWDVKDFKVYRSGYATAVCTMTDSAWRLAMRTPAQSLSHRSSATTCQDSVTSPAVPTSGTVTYTLRATSFAPDGLAQTEGGNVQTSINVNTTNTNAKPSQPTSFNAVKIGTNQWRFSWTAPGGRGTGAPPANNCITSYRIYRTTSAASQPTLADRRYRTDTGVVYSPSCLGPAVGTFDSWPGTLTTSPSGGQQKFWITSVDLFNNESNPRATTVTNP